MNKSSYLFRFTQPIKTKSRPWNCSVMKITRPFIGYVHVDKLTECPWATLTRQRLAFNFLPSKTLWRAPKFNLQASALSRAIPTRLMKKETCTSFGNGDRNRRRASFFLLCEGWYSTELFATRSRRVRQGDRKSHCSHAPCSEADPDPRRCAGAQGDSDCSMRAVDLMPLRFTSSSVFEARKQSRFCTCVLQTIRVS